MTEEAEGPLPLPGSHQAVITYLWGHLMIDLKKLMTTPKHPESSKAPPPSFPAFLRLLFFPLFGVIFIAFPPFLSLPWTPAARVTNLAFTPPSGK